MSSPSSTGDASPALHSAGRIRRAIRTANDEGHAALVVYLPAGFPDLLTSRACLQAAAEAGADVLEVGLPYSDPLMDGPTIQAACQAALDLGLTPEDDLAMCAELTRQVDVPVLCMTYYNLAWRYPGGHAPSEPSEPYGNEGLEAFAATAQEAGLTGAILPDLPPEEADPWMEAALANNLATVFLAAPTSTNERLAAVARSSSGFVYATSTLGVTGERDSLSAMAGPLVERIRSVAEPDQPVCVGIGVTTAAHAAEVAGFADGVIVGSAAVRAAAEGGPGAVAALVRELAEGCRRTGG